MGPAGAQTTPDISSEAIIAGRIDRLPVTYWHNYVRILLGFVLFFDSWDSIAIAFIAPSLIHEWHLNPAEVGLLIAIGYLGQIFGAYLFGAVAERYGRIRAFQLATALMSIVGLAAAFSPNYATLLILRAIQGLGIGGALPAGLAYINEISPSKNRGRFVILFQYMTVAGFPAASIAAVWIIPHLGWGAMLAFGAMPLLVLPLIHWLVPESPRWLALKGRLPEAEAILARIESKAFANRPVPPLIVPEVTKESGQPTRFSEMFKGRYGKRTFALGSVWFLLGFVVFGLLTWVPSIFVTVYHLPVDEALKNSIIPNLGTLIKPLFIAYIIDWMGRRRFGMWMTGAAAITLCILMSATSPSMLLLITLLTIGQNLVGGANLMLWGYTAELYPTRMRAVAVGALSACSRAASTVAPITIGAIVAVTGSAYAVFALLAASTFAAFLILWLVCEETAGRSLEEISP